MSLVIDASITLSWFFKEEQTAASLAIFDQVCEAGALVPILWRFEVANGLQMAVRRRRIAPADRDESLADLEDMEVAVDPEGSTLAWSSGIRLADKHSLTVYDAAYLELALRRRLELATLNGALAEAARAEHLRVIGT